MAPEISFVNRGNCLFEVRGKKEGHWARRPVSAGESSSPQDELRGPTDSNSFLETSASELKDIAISYTRDDSSFFNITERKHLEDPALPEKWNCAGPWEGCAYLKVEDGANDRGFMEPMERTPHNRNRRRSLLRRKSGLSTAAKRTAFDGYDDDADEDMRDYYEIFDWADTEWNESFAGRSKEEILERDLFRTGLREWTPSELKARYGVTSKAYLVRLLRRRKLVLCDGDDDYDDDYDDDEEEDGGGAFLQQQRDGRTDWGRMTKAEQDAFSTALAQEEVGMCKVSGLCDLPAFQGFPQAAFVPLSPTREESEPRMP
ncbi:hypothetical protein PG994_008722 [Apiospora phragmitis]|uniref:Uncharacterized protein n=1 Tax=Apiospora phragmitis TaxID=2905665 RepID=A0ABR1UH95_9PEZI